MLNKAILVGRLTADPELKKALYEFRGMSISNSKWVYGGFYYEALDDTCFIITEDGGFVPIYAITLGRKIICNNLVTYHGDILSVVTFLPTADKASTLKDTLFTSIGIVMNSRLNILATEDRHSCGFSLNELDIHIVGTIFDRDLDSIGKDLYKPPAPFTFKGYKHYGAEPIYGGYHYNQTDKIHYIVNSVPNKGLEFTEVLSAHISIDLSDFECDKIAYECDSVNMVLDGIRECGIMIWDKEECAYSIYEKSRLEQNNDFKIYKDICYFTCKCLNNNV